MCYRLFWSNSEENPSITIGHTVTFNNWTDAQVGIREFVAELLVSGMEEAAVRRGYVYTKMIPDDDGITNFVGELVDDVWCCVLFWPQNNDNRAISAVPGVGKRWVKPTPGLPGTYCVTVHGTGSCGHEYAWWGWGRRSSELAEELRLHPDGEWVRVGLCEQCELMELEQGK